MAAPAFCEALRLDAAHRLYRYTIRHHRGCAILWRYDDDHGWRIAGVYPSEEAAESYLHGKLPAIESEM